MSTEGSRDREQSGSAGAGRQEWNWRPSSGEGSASALNKLHRMERVKHAWREVRGTHPSREPKNSGE